MSRYLDFKWCIVLSLFLCLLVFISILAYRNVLDGSGLNQYDKAGHFILFGLLGLLSHLALKRRCWRFKSISIPIAPTVIALLVVVDELCQALSPHRTAGWPDLVANWLGILTFVTVDAMIRNRRQLVRSV